ncbi:DEAD/DEAH box helicase [Luteimicrobium subarcticum]|uniref:DEAD/DEAH box helicase n=1 Tax=Luteimicrobium subarcticum TaxID=620910 RepID=UPI001FE4107B|nr:DEAD/DEAH box helicase [Luteimicrobium subarcticum]
MPAARGPHGGRDDEPSPLLDVLLTGRGRADSLRHVRVLPARDARHRPWPVWADPALVAGYRALGVAEPWEHQAVAAEAAWAGRHVALATSTGSGKSLAFWLPALTSVRDDVAARRAADTFDAGRIETVRAAGPGGRGRGAVLYLCPTKALAADQLSALQRLLAASGVDRGRDAVRVATCDGDASQDERRWVRDHADVVLTNPDFLHYTLLPDHRRWSRLLASLRYVVVDEGHAYRGVFGAHVALVLRRLRRLADHHRATGRPAPTFVVASATSADPAGTVGRLVGVDPDDVVTVADDTSPAGRKTFVLWEPPELEGVEPPEVAAARAAGTAGAVRRTRSAGGPAQSADDDWAALADALLVDPTAHDDLGLVDEPDGPAVVGDAPERARRSATAEAAHLLADLVASGARTLAFTRSRRGAESVALATQDHLRHVSAELAATVAAYRGGYLPEERRELEAGLRSGAVRGLATTNALELGIDVSGLDAVLVAGWPGTRTSLWQQAGRAGRAGAEGLVAFVAREDPLDTYLVHHPEAVLDAPLEATVFDPANPYVLAPHLCAAAAELPLRTDELDTFGDAGHVRGLLDVLSDRGALRRRTSGWYWTHARPAASMADLRGSGGPSVRVVEESTGRMLGTVDSAAADSTVHPGAVYVHQGRTFVVRALESEGGWSTGSPDSTDDAAGHPTVALVEERQVDFGTWARTSSTVRLASDEPVHERAWGPSVTWGYGPVEVSSQVVSFQRRHLPDLRILSDEDLDLPERYLSTMAVWWTVETSVLDAAGLTEEAVPGALHAAEHASIGLLPLLATCDRWDLGGLSTALHVDTEQATVFVHDGLAGGAGFAERGFHLAATWLRATRDAIASCPCADGCPGCVQSPKCGNLNHPLDKDGARRLLDVVLAAAPPA